MYLALGKARVSRTNEFKTFGHPNDFCNLQDAASISFLITAMLQHITAVAAWASNLPSRWKKRKRKRKKTMMKMKKKMMKTMMNPCWKNRCCCCQTTCWGSVYVYVCLRNEAQALFVTV